MLETPYKIKVSNCLKHSVVELLSEGSFKIDALNLKFNDISLYMKNNSEQRQIKK